MSLILDFEGPVPKHVAINGVCYSVDSFKRPPLRCFRCLLFGHGSLTCKFTKVRCQRCCQIHDEQQGSVPCTNPFFCLFCGDNHKYSDRSCRINRKAEDIERKKEEGTLTDADAREDFKALNNSRFNHKNSRPSREYTTPGASTSRPSTSGQYASHPRQDASVRRKLPDRKTTTIQNNYYDVLSEDSDFYPSHEDSRRNRRHQNKTQYFTSPKKSYKDAAINKTSTHNFPPNYNNPLNDHNYTAPVTTSREYQSHVQKD